ncbi:hypothetical protein D3C86_1427200 [compost metagenome]
MERMEVLFFGIYIKDKRGIMKKKYFLISLIIISLSCKKIGNEQKEIAATFFDSIKCPEKLEKKCSVLTNGYSKKFGIILSNYFEVSDKLYYDINKDNKVDTLLILTPASIIPGEKGYNCNSRSDLDDRLLVILNNIDGKKSKVKIFKNVISNQASVAWSGSEEFEKYENGFELKKSAGQGCKFDYSIFVNTKNEQIVIDSLKLSSFCPSGSGYKEKKINFQKAKKIELFNKKMIDSIKLAEDL